MPPMITTLWNNGTYDLQVEKDETLQVTLLVWSPSASPHLPSDSNSEVTALAWEKQGWIYGGLGRISRDLVRYLCHEGKLPEKIWYGGPKGKCSQKGWMTLNSQFQEDTQMNGLIGVSKAEDGL